MLKTRIVTAAILIALVGGVILVLPNWAFSLLSAGIVLLGAWEWAALSGLVSSTSRWLYVALVALGLITVYGLSQSALVDFSILGIAAFWWFYFYAVILPPRIKGKCSLPTWKKPTWVVLGFLILISSWLAVVTLRNQTEFGSSIVMFLVLLIAVADSAAYSVGRLLGVTPLAPAVSPSKTREGVYGALVASLLFALVCGIAFQMSDFYLLAFVLLSVSAVIFSVVGDLFESMAKRAVGIKDSGWILPGHGGVLDRIDSLTAAAPIFAIGALWLFGGRAVGG